MELRFSSQSKGVRIVGNPLQSVGAPLPLQLQSWLSVGRTIDIQDTALVPEAAGAFCLGHSGRAIQAWRYQTQQLILRTLLLFTSRLPGIEWTFNSTFPLL